MFKTTCDRRKEIDDIRSEDLNVQLRRKVNAFLLPMKVTPPHGGEALIGAMAEQAQMRGEAESHSNGEQHPEAAGSRVDARGAEPMRKMRRGRPPPQSSG